MLKIFPSLRSYFSFAHGPAKLCQQNQGSRVTVQLQEADFFQPRNRPWLSGTAIVAADLEAETAPLVV